MPYASKTQTFYWTFDCPADRIWTVLADTERFNEAAKLPKYAVTEAAQPDQSVKFFGKVALGPYSINWQEIPTNFVRNSWWRHERRFSSGPLAVLCATLRVYPEGETCRAEYELTAQPGNILGWLMASTTFFPSTKKQFDGLAEQARLFATGRSDIEFDIDAPKLQPGATEILQAAADSLSRSPHEHGLAPRLIEFISKRSEVDVRRMRPLALARRWGVQATQAVEVCLQAARDNLLAMNWDLVCPRCQGAKARAASLDQLPHAAHCSTCNIDYTRDYTKNVEMTFCPSRRVRRIDDREFCVFAPMSTPHVLAQITVAPGETVQIPHPELKLASYRVRTLAPGPEADVDWSVGPFPEAHLDDDGLRTVASASPGKFTFSNSTGRSATFVIDEAQWSSEAFTADRAMTLQAFRDLFDDAILRPGDCLQIDQVTILFIDLKGSSLLYEQSGDMQAYHLVREFFAIAAAAVRRRNGAVVKTVGDAINAAFDKPEDAVACALDVKDAVARYNESSGKPPIVCKIGLNAGKSIAVTLNNRLDYYGTAVNKASRLADLSTGADIVVAKDLADDPAVAAMVSRFAVSDDQATVKGFPKPVQFVRVEPPSANALDALRALAAG